MVESCGRYFDAMMHQDLDRDGLRLTKPYRLPVTGSHPDYVSAGMYDAVEQAMEEGYRLV
ncbi:N,N-dimethylformamidase beta subunit family domain-containing protein [Mesorhizobium sp. M0664]|uniref:N,N-dimethylformamidase beta subunit family domain-containing protein n=1 Tax=Mesorhizobium sp. M0664 TaxID=2956982 RepID=UPI00333A142A